MTAAAMLPFDLTDLGLFADSTPHDAFRGLVTQDVNRFDVAATRRRATRVSPYID